MQEVLSQVIRLQQSAELPKIVTLLCHILSPESQSHSDNGHVHATAPCSVCAFAHARPTMSCIPLVQWIIMHVILGEYCTDRQM